MIRKSEIENLFAQALDFVSQKSQKTIQEVITLLQQEDVWTNSSLRYALADYLCRNSLPIDMDNIVKAVYIFGSTLRDEARLTSDIDLIFLVVSKKSIHLNFLKVLDDALLKQYKSLIGKQVRNMKSILNVHLVNRKDVKAKRGYGAVVNSIHNPPIKIWTNSKDDKNKPCRLFNSMLKFI